MRDRRVRREVDLCVAEHETRREIAIAFVGLVLLGLPTGMLGIAWPSMRVSLDAPLVGLGLLVAAMTVARDEQAPDDPAAQVVDADETRAGDSALATKPAGSSQ